MNNDRTVWLVTHAATQLKDKDGNWLPDPAMTESAVGEITALKPMLTEKLGGKAYEVHCGVGRRQWQVSCALGFSNPKEVYFSSLWGDAATLAKIGDDRVVLLGHGVTIPYDQYLSAKHVGGNTITRVIVYLPDNAVICSGRPVLVRLGMKPEQCHSGALYALKFDFGILNIRVELVRQGKILT